MFDLNFNKAANLRKTLAIEFCPDRIRLLQFKRTTGNFTVQSFAEAEIVEGVYANGVIKQPVDVGNLLTQLMQVSKPEHPDTQYVICLVPQSHIFTMSLEVPKVSREEVTKLIENKIDDLIPMPTSEVYWDWRIVHDKDNKYRVQIAAISKEIIDSYMATLKEARLIPLLFEPSAEAAARVGKMMEVKENQKVVMVELCQDCKATVSLLGDSGVLFSTEVAVDSSPTGQLQVRSLVSKINELATYASKDIADAQSLKVQVRVFGDPQLVAQGLPALKEAAPGLEVVRIRYSEANAGSVLSLIPEEKLDSYVALIGAAIRGLPNFSDDDVSLNLVPAQAKQAFIRKEVANIMRKYMLFITVDVGLIVIAMALVFNIMQQQIDNLEAQYASIQAISQSRRAKDLELSIQKLNVDSKRVVDISSQIYDWSRILTDLSANTPAGVTVINLSVVPPTVSGPDDYIVTITGKFDERSTVIDFVENLRRSALFSEVKLPVSSLQSETNGQYSIEAKLIRTKLIHEAGK